MDFIFLGSNQSRVESQMQSKMFFVFLFCIVILQVQTTTISREDLAPFLQELKNEILGEIEPIKKRLELYDSGFQELKANVEGIGLKINKLSSEFNQTQSVSLQEELNNDSEFSSLRTKVNHLKFMSKMIKVI